MRVLVLATALALVILPGCSGNDTLTVYSGRSEELIAPLIERFETTSGIDVEVRYGDSAELAATILEEGDNSPADVFLAQDPASLGAVAQAGLFTTLNAAITDRVPARFADDAGRWVGISGRARTMVYDTTSIDAATLPATEDALTGAEWRGRVAIAPTNGSFLAFVAAKILVDGEPATLAWLEGMAANQAPTYPNNSSIVAAVDDGAVEAGLVNHYYLFRRIAEEGTVNAANHFLTGSAGALIMPAGAGILHADAVGAAELIEFLLSAESQAYFANETYEYPMASGVAPNPNLPDLASLDTPVLNLSDLAGVLDRATDLVAEAGLL